MTHGTARPGCIRAGRVPDHITPTLELTVTSNPDRPAVERVARHLAAKGWATTPDGWDGATASFRAEYLALAREVIALAQEPAPPSVSAVDQTTRDRIAEALVEARRPGLGGMTEAEAVGYMADAVMAALLPTDRSSAPAGDEDCERCEGSGLDPDAYFRNGNKWTHAPCSACQPEDDETALRRLADEAQQPAVGARQPNTETPGLHAQYLEAARGALQRHAQADGTEAAEFIAAAMLDARDRAMEQLRRERDLAIAHDRQPYPTAWAYEQACKTLRRKEAAIEGVLAVLDEYEGTDWSHTIPAQRIRAAASSAVPGRSAATSTDEETNRG